MAAPKEPPIDLKTVTVDGVTFYVIIDKDEAEALIKSARNTIFMSELTRRAQKVLWIGGFVTAGLVAISTWWPTIDAVMRAVFKGLPNG